MPQTIESMKLTARYLIFAVLIGALGSAAGQRKALAQQVPKKAAQETRAHREKLQAPSQVSDAQKKEFIQMLDTLPHEGEFYTAAAIDKAGPYLPVLLALTEKDLEQLDIYPFAAMSRGLCDRKQHRAYAVRHFAEIRHPMLQLAWAAMLFDAGASSPEIVRFLRKALKDEKQSQLLSEMIGPEFEQFKKRVMRGST